MFSRLVTLTAKNPWSRSLSALAFSADGIFRDFSARFSPICNTQVLGSFLIGSTSSRLLDLLRKCHNVRTENTYVQKKCKVMKHFSSNTTKIHHSDFPISDIII